MPSQIVTPLQYTPILPFMSDKQLALFVPFVVYWIYSGFYHLISTYEVSFFEKYRIHSLIEIETRNKVSMGEVIRAVLLQQFLQTLLGLLLVVVDDDDVLLDDEVEMLAYRQMLETTTTSFGLWNLVEPYQSVIINTLYWYLIPLSRFLFAMIFLDTWQYFMHRFFHQNKFLYKHIHSLHHRLHAPYAFGALYNHPVEGFVMDSVGAGLSFKLSGMTTIGGMIFFGFATFKTVDDHCGYDLPFNPIQKIFGNNSAYHDIHHQVYGIKMNFSQPFFTIWDRLLGTYLPEPPKLKDSLKEYQSPQTTTIHSLTLKARELIDLKDEPKVFKIQETISAEISPVRYNLRSRKTLS
ncbi:fatty acid hydroxylase superfamily-domain-containing protein [Glomus cerebriforme]|uniref:Fatty acid hydroxylase superfamily-domain-containing protein n=1 Tax=Glomus cerebriforme TaxID=658196 RepID=A0A397TN71_9GLOM|nr:fatty acid hydroxylase superfamily-domain-containing protein [Glomus cerebriforme]